MTDNRRESESAFDPNIWSYRAEGGYRNLGWVSASKPLEKIVELADLKGKETVVDVGTGSLAVLKALGSYVPNGKLIGFDISLEMMREGINDSTFSKKLFQADVYSIPLSCGFADLVTVRMVLHHIDNTPLALEEMYRILKPKGKMLAVEYIASDDEVQSFERKVFDIKEKGRHLWTGESFADLVKNHWLGPKNDDLSLDYSLLPQYSVRDWMGKSGLPEEIQLAVLECYLNAPKSVVQKMNITFTPEGDALVDRPFAYVLVRK